MNELDPLYDQGYADGFANAETSLRPVCDKLREALSRLLYSTDETIQAEFSPDVAKDRREACEALRWAMEVFDEQ